MELEVDSDSSGSVIITGPIPEYPELRRRKPVRTPVPAKNCHPNKRRKEPRKEPVVDMTQDEKAKKLQQLEDLVKASATLPRSGNNKDDDVDASSGSDTKSIKGSDPSDPISKHLKKIKTLQQNKRRQETRISRLTKEVRSLRDKVNVQAAYIDVLCGMLGDDIKEKFRGRQGMGILGNTKIEDDPLDDVAGAEHGENGTCSHEDAANDKCLSEEALKEKEREFYCVEDLDEVEENGMSRAGSSEDLKKAIEYKDETREDKVARPLEVAGPSTSYAGIGMTGKEACVREMNALTIAVGSMKQDPVRLTGNALPQCDENQIGGNNGQGEIHHEVFGAPYERRICNYEGQVGESVFAQVPRVTSKETNPYGEMRVQVAYVEPHMEPMPPTISYGMVKGKHGLNLLPAVHPTTNDPLNIGSDDSSPFGPLIISTSLDPLNLISHASTTDRMKMVQPTTSSHDPLNIGFDDALIDDPRALPEEVDPIGQNHQSSALFISIPSSTAESDKHLSEMSYQPMETDSISEPQPTSSSTGTYETSFNSSITGNVQAEIPANLPYSGHDGNLNLHSNSQEVHGALSMPQISDMHSDVEHQDEGYENYISQPQAIVDHLINSFSCGLSPDLRLE